MKYPMWAFLLAATCGGIPAAQAQDEGGPLLSPVQLNLQNATADDQLIKLARAAKINVMADASDGPVDKPADKLKNAAAGTIAGTTLTVAKKQTVLDWLRDMAAANHLTWQRSGGNTVMLWPKLDLVPLARDVTAAAIARRPQIISAIKPDLQATLAPELVARLDAEPDQWSTVQDRFLLYQYVVDNSLRTLLQKQQGWDGKDQNFQLQLKGEAVPADLRSHLIVLRRLIQSQPDQVRSAAWLNDETWQKARLMVQQSPLAVINGKTQRNWALNVTAPINGQEARQSAATWTQEGGGQ